MIKPIQESDIALNKFVVVDIENWPDGSVLAIDTAWRENGVIQHESHMGWADWWDWLTAKARDDKRFRVLYAHNGGGWDWLSLAHYLLTDGKRKRQSISAACACSKMITMSVIYENQFTISLCDSLQLLRSKLADLARKFGVQQKIDLGDLLPHQIWEQNKALFVEYHRRDTESLLCVLESALELIRERIAKIDTFAFTIGSTAMKVWKTIGLAEPIRIPEDPKLKEFLREGYRGGRVEVFQPGYYEKVKVYDVNSLYPYAMLTTEVPISDRGVWVDFFDPSLPGCYTIEFEQRNKSIPAVLLERGLGVYSGIGTFYTPEIALLKEVDPTCRVKVKKGFKFYDRERVFSDYVNRIYAVRLSDPDGPLSLLGKFLLNSLYGKLGQNSKRVSIVAYDPEDFDAMYNAVKGDAKITPLNEALGVFKAETERDCKFEHVGIAAMITSAARVILYRGMLSAGIENVVYCDTDSVHSLCNINLKLVSDRIGDFKVEFEGEGCYVGKKLYALRKGEKVKIRAKGVSVGGRNGASIGFDDFVAMAKGESRTCVFQSPPSANEVFSGRKNPCRFGPRKRTIKRLIK